MINCAFVIDYSHVQIQDPVPPEMEVSSPARAKYRRLHSEHEDTRLDMEGDIAQRSLESVLTLAQQELEMEESKKKVGLKFRCL